jgi:hypothetical protein
MRVQASVKAVTICRQWHHSLSGFKQLSTSKTTTACRFSPPPAGRTATGATSPSKKLYVTSPRTCTSPQLRATSPTQLTRPQPFKLSTGRVKSPRLRSAPIKPERCPQTRPCRKDPFANTKDRAAAQRAASPRPLSAQLQPFRLNSIARHEQYVERSRAQQQKQLTAEAERRRFRARPTSPAVCTSHVIQSTLFNPKLVNPKSDNPK